MEKQLLCLIIVILQITDGFPVALNAMAFDGLELGS